MPTLLTELNPKPSIKEVFYPAGHINSANFQATVKPNFERFAKNYISDEPDILFTAEYIVEGKRAGILVVWEKYYDSTHYELFKRNVFKSAADFERILFLDTQSLEEERGHFIDYIRNTLGFTDINENNIYIFLDDLVKEDRIYEYKVSGARLPKSASEVDYDMILESKDLVNPVEVARGSSATIFSFAGANLGSTDLAWIVSLSNDDLEFFGQAGHENAIAQMISPNASDGKLLVFVPKKIDDIMMILKDSLNLFSTKEVFKNLLESLGGLLTGFRDAFLNSVDEEEIVFSYDSFSADVKSKVPVFSMLLEISESDAANATTNLSSLSIVLPKETGTESLTSLDRLTKILKFVDETMIVLLYAQEEKTFSKLQEIYAAVAAKQQNDLANTATPLDGAVEKVQSDMVSYASPANDPESVLFGISQGEVVDTKDTSTDTSTDASSGAPTSTSINTTRVSTGFRVV